MCNTITVERNILFQRENKENLNRPPIFLQVYVLRAMVHKKLASLARATIYENSNVKRKIIFHENDMVLD